jgi:hypothetical protein
MIHYSAPLLLLFLLGCSNPTTTGHETTKNKFDTIADQTVRHRILWAVIAFHKTHFPDYVDLTPIDSTITKVLQAQTTTDDDQRVIEIWAFKCKDKIFVHQLDIYILSNNVAYIHVVTTEGFPKIRMA